jgi:hypothetical protein
MVMVTYQAIGVAQPMESLNNLCQCTQKYQAIFVILETASRRSLREIT